MTRSDDLVRERSGSSGVLSRVLRRARRGRIIAALVGVVVVGLAAGVGILTARRRPVVVSSGRDRMLRVWDLATGAQVAHYDRIDEPRLAVTTTRLGGRSVVVSDDRSGDGFRVWDLATSTPIGRPLDGHLGTSVDALATAQLDGRTVIISGGGDGTVRVWDLAGVRP